MKLYSPCLILCLMKKLLQPAKLLKLLFKLNNDQAPFPKQLWNLPECNQIAFVLLSEQWTCSSNRKSLCSGSPHRLLSLCVQRCYQQQFCKHACVYPFVGNFWGMHNYISDCLPYLTLIFFPQKGGLVCFFSWQ